MIRLFSHHTVPNARINRRAYTCDDSPGLLIIESNAGKYAVKEYPEWMPTDKKDDFVESVANSKSYKAISKLISMATEIAVMDNRLNQTFYPDKNEKIKDISLGTWCKVLKLGGIERNGIIVAIDHHKVTVFIPDIGLMDCETKDIQSTGNKLAPQDTGLK